MMHWDSLETAAGIILPASVYVKSLGIADASGQTDGVTTTTQLKATVDPGTGVKVNDTLHWKGDAYTVVSALPVSGKGVLRFEQLTLTRSVG